MQVLIEHQPSWPECEASLFQRRDFSVCFLFYFLFHENVVVPSLLQLLQLPGFSP